MTNSVTKMQDNADLIALQSSVDWALQIAEAPTDQITLRQAALIPGATREITAWLQPASKEQMAIEMDGLRSWARAFKIPAPDLETVTATYQAALKHLPPDLLKQAFTTIKSRHKYGMRLPLPSEMAATVSPEYSRRVKIKMGLWRASRAQVDTTPIDRVSPEKWADLKRGLAEKFPSRPETSQEAEG